MANGVELDTAEIAKRNKCLIAVLMRIALGVRNADAYLMGGKMKNKEVAEMFAQGKRKCETKHLFIEGNTIYSYGKHFPIAIRLWDGYAFKYIWNSDKYSVTTSRHQSLVLNAIGNNNILKKVDTQKMDDYKHFKDVKEVMVEALEDETY